MNLVNAFSNEGKQMNSLKKNILYNTLYQILIIILPFVSAPYLSRVLGTNGVGQYSYTYAVANYFVLFAMLGLTNYGNREIAACGNNKPKRDKTFSEIYAMQAIWASGLTIIYILYILILVERYRLIALIQAVYVLSAVLDINWLFFGLEKFKLTVIRNFVVKVGTFVCIFIFVKEEGDVWKYTLIMAAGTLVSQLCMWLYLPQYIKIKPVTFSEIKKHIKPNLILFIPVISYSIYKVMDKIMLGNLSTIEAVGLYEYAEKLVNLPLGFISAFGTVMLPRMSNLTAQGDTQKIMLYIGKSMKYVTLIAAAMAFGLMSVGDIFAPLYYGKEFAVSGVLIQMLAITLIPISWANIIRTQFLIPAHRDSIYLTSTVFGAAVNLIINLLMIPKYSYYGAVIGTIAAEFSVVVVQIIGTRKEFDYRTQFRHIFPYLIFGGVMFCILTELKKSLHLSWLSLVILVGIGAFIYLTLSIVYLLWIERDQEIRKMIGKYVFRRVVK